MTQARQLGYTGVIMGSDGWPNIIGGKQDYASAADLNNCFYNSSFVASNTDKKVQDFVAAYQEEYQSAPTNFCALGYDAAMIVCQALAVVEKAGYTLGTLEYRKATIEAIASNKVDGVTGAISYNGSGDPVKSTLIVAFQDGKEVIYDTIEG